MKWIKSRNKFITEAKLKDVILKKQHDKVKNKWGTKYLEYEEVEPTENIIQGKWKLSEEDKNSVLGHFFGSDMSVVFSTFDSLPEKFVNLLKESIDINRLDDKYQAIFDEFDPNKPTVDQITCIHDPMFRKISINDTKSTSVIKKGEDGRPIKDDDGQMVRIEKNAGDPIFETNLVSIKGFTEAYNRCYEDNKVDEESFYSRDISSLISMSKDNHDDNFKIDFKIFDRDIYLSIKHSAQDILNMSISTFFSSCQHLYSGCYNHQVLGNVFDPNSIPAFLVFDTPIFWGDDVVSENLPLSRMIIRNIDSFEETDEKKIFFDRAYPDRMKEIFGEIVTKYSGNKETVTKGPYLYTPDLDTNDDLAEPYMDRMGLKKRPYIGLNTKSIYMNRNFDWSQVKISKNAKIKEMVIETDILPDNIGDIKLTPDWIKFSMVNISNFDPFRYIITSSIAFDKCKLDLSTLHQFSENLKNLKLISCDVDGDLSSLVNLEELHLIFSLDDLEELKGVMEKVSKSLNKIVLSSDLFVSKESKEYLKSLRNNIKVEIIGPKI